MANPGCDDCIPYCWKPVLIPGYGTCCSECGRILPEDELILVTNAPPPPRRSENPWERGIRRDGRGVPYLDSNGLPLRMGEPFDPRKYNEGTIEIGGN